MAKQKEMLVIWDEDALYAKNLCDALNRRENFPFSCVVLSEDGGALSNAAVLLVSERAKRDEIQCPVTKETIFLTDVKGYSAVNKKRAIFKYQPVSALEAEIMKAYGEGKERSHDRPGLSRTRVIAVASPVGRSLKTSFSFVLGQLLSQSSAVLYVNLEPFGAFSALFEEPFQYDLSDLLYAFHAGTEHTKEQEDAFLAHFHGLDFVAPAGTPEDVMTTDPAVIRDLVLKLAEVKAYDAVIVDIGPDFRHLLAMLPVTDKVYVPTRGDRMSREKTDLFVRWVQSLSRDEGPDVETLELPAGNLFRSGKNYLEQLLFTELGDYVRKLLGEAF